ncbi:erythropoietin receptor isoform X2 [Ranitomeya variabilis]|uniref:erythropoietin receptor isoform X2 n=2 Tax=Ranitomeya variabilis TaxID=490064 RepID=UPI0040564FC2
MPSWTGAAYPKNMSRKPRSLYYKCLFLSMWMAVCSGKKNDPTLSSRLNDVSSVIEDQSVLPWCFTTALFDLTCFWESGRSDAFSYTFQYEFDGKTEICNLMTVAAPNGTWWHVCQFPEDKVHFFSADPYPITVTDNWRNSSFSRNCTTEKVVYLEPIVNITVKEQSKPLGLLITLHVTNISMLFNSLMYEVKYTRDESSLQKTEMFTNVEAQQGYVKLFLYGVINGAEYTLSVRAKAYQDFNGYWSQWSKDIHIKISNVDVLYIILYVICGLIPIVALILITAYQRRFLKKKVWPKIPSPEHHFKELYTTHKGNFMLWVDQTDSYLNWISRNIYHEGPISTLEVLSELPMPPPLPSSQPAPKDSYVALDKTFLPQFPAWMITQRQIDAQMELLSHTETPGQKTSRGEGKVEEDVVEITAEEVPPVGGHERYPTKEKPGSLTIQREDSLNSEDSKPSPGSSFEYTALQTCEGLLSPRVRSIPPRHPLKYAYLLMSESGEESPPPSPNIYQNSICAQLPTHIYSQC